MSNFLDAAIPGSKPKKKPPVKTGGVTRGRGKRTKREKLLKSLDLKEEFSIVKEEAFISYCLAAFGLTVAKKTVVSHKRKGFSQLKEHWKLKYLAFFHYLK